MAFEKRHLRILLIATLVVAVTLLGDVAPTAAQPILPVRMHTVDIALPAGTQPFASAGQALSDPQDTPPFAMVAAQLPVGADVEVRTARGDGPWSDWVPLADQHEDGPDAGSDEGWSEDGLERTHPTFTGPADRLQVRVSGADVTDVDAFLIDPFGLDRTWTERAADAMRTAWHGPPPNPAHATVGMPPILTRAQWGANESIVGGTPSYARDVDRVFVHHTVGSNGYSQAEAAGVVRGVQAYHVNGNGWDDIGYNFLVDRFGTMYEGRGGGMDRAVIGAQAGGFNIRSTGIALMGTYTNATPDAAMVDAVQQIAAWKADVHHFNPLGFSDALSGGSTRFPKGQVVNLPNIAGHRDVSTTACPGNGPYGLLDAIRSGVRDRAGDLIVDHDADILTTRVIRGQPDAPGVTFQAGMDPPGPWTLTVRDPGGDVVHRATGDGAAVSTVMPTDNRQWAVGEYHWEVASPGRRSATERIEMVPPTIRDAGASALLATADADGRLNSPVAFGAELWRDASWELRITDPLGRVVLRDTGQGDRMDAIWSDGMAEPGMYGWVVAAEDAVPVTGTIEGRYDLLDRIADTDDPVWAAALLSATTFPPGTATRAVIARQDVFADALAGGPLAGGDGPLLLTGSAALDGRVANELARVLAPGAQIFVLGGTAAISPSVADDLTAFGSVRRLSGGSRFATAAAIAGVVVQQSGTTEAMIARAGPDDAAPWADALSGGAYGAAAGIPVLLTDTAALNPTTAQALVDLRVTSTFVLGGTAAVSDQAMAGLPSPQRLSGADRTATAVAVADRLWGRAGPVDRVLLANGYGEGAWAWALAAAPLAARQGAALLLTTPDNLAAPTAAALRDLGVAGGQIVGSSALVSERVGQDASAIIRRR